MLFTVLSFSGRSVLGRVRLGSVFPALPVQHGEEFSNVCKHLLDAGVLGSQDRLDVLGGFADEDGIFAIVHGNPFCCGIEMDADFDLYTSLTHAASSALNIHHPNFARQSGSPVIQGYTQTIAARRLLIGKL